MSYGRLKAVKGRLRSLLELLQIVSLRSAVREQGLEDLSLLLSEIIPDLVDQYTTFKVDTEYLRSNVRSQHAFQITLALKALDILLNRENNGSGPFSVIDIGDSSGTHVSYLKSLIEKYPRFASYNFRFLSVNVDDIAVKKIHAKGLEAILCRAEELQEKYRIKADILLTFEMLEHLSDPVLFLDTMSRKSAGEYFVVTVPYLKESRIGLHHIRHQQYHDVFPENTHIFELCPADWKLIFSHAGWEIVNETIYLQYPRKSVLRLMKYIWRRLDFEGFYGVILKRNRSWAECYKLADHTD